ncbi:bifunctional triacylglycerol lipase/ester hydrolase [Aspergillus glaucus CBS 516.65]|uniref:Lipid droplet-associated hydrolase n=1 Tax=Aspergillus glaucus CBS 516.65 TaxID=1160497 RepID=A0A1L9V8J4_ASPGL|nr:hypothetical protein ASPGLDRAFT_135239 [Aspergillus glaucus CBS 516.65]OJJ80266.1 hypothetical protein ASPGLDRAFT_135239 [Aspergillus glaucus CBS 516.65]
MSLITPDSFLRLPANANGDKAPITIFFITGNPGLIGYYHTFLSLLSDRLGLDGGSSFQVFGHSLAGFELSKEQEGRKEKAVGEGEEKGHYYNLEEQISYVQRKLGSFITNHYEQNQQNHDGEVPKVILIGHSVGTYIAMEVLRRHRERQRQHATTITTPSNNTTAAEFDIIGGVMLFPTVVDIAKSPAGQRLSKLLSLIPGLAVIASLFARVLSALLPGGLLRLVVAAFMSLSSSLESPDRVVVDTTCGFLGSRGVRQALHLGADEMQTITSDKWSDDIWGMSDVEEPLAKLFFYFGRNDHWVAERTRDEIIAVRGKDSDNEIGKGNGPTMVVCEDGLPHAFCLSEFFYTSFW